mmetsp:Transcript_14959/g.32885  ORF Transcript_14959/g.32885 Transcript_14959/m.32885 type:complete len:252 (-) Transcript_14959:74-829(-)
MEEPGDFSDEPFADRCEMLAQLEDALRTMEAVVAVAEATHSRREVTAAETAARTEPWKVPSIFASSHEADLALLGRHYSPNIFEWVVQSGGRGVTHPLDSHEADFASDLQMRCAARLRAREQSLQAKELGAVWMLHRREMLEAEARDAALLSTVREHSTRSSRTVQVGDEHWLGAAGPLPRRWPQRDRPWLARAEQPRPLRLPVHGPRLERARLPQYPAPQARYLNELMHANMEGYLAAVQALSPWPPREQ